MASINDLAAAAMATSSTTGEKHGRGALVVLEGLDRSGKTTQVKLLEQRFVEAGRKVKVMRFPGGWPSSPREDTSLAHSRAGTRSTSFTLSVGSLGVMSHEHC